MVAFSDAAADSNTKTRVVRDARKAFGNLARRGVRTSRTAAKHQRAMVRLDILSVLRPMLVQVACEIEENRPNGRERDAAFRVQQLLSGEEQLRLALRLENSVWAWFDAFRAEAKKASGTPNTLQPASEKSEGAEAATPGDLQC